MKKEHKILINFSLYLLTFILIIIVGISGVFADTIMDTGSWINVTGRQWTLSGQEYTSSPTFNDNWLLNSYNVTGGIYTPPTSYDYIEYSMFQHNSGAYNPCNNGSFNASFDLLFTTPSFVNYVSTVTWANKLCSITDKNSSTGRVKVQCNVSPVTSNISTIKVNYIEFTTTNNSNIYISRRIPIACVLSPEELQSQLNQQTGSINNSITNSQNNIINNNNNNTQNIINNQNEMRDSINNNQNENTDKQIDSQKVCDSKTITKDDVKDSGYFLNSTGQLVSHNDYGVTDYLNFQSLSVSNILGSSPSVCFYNKNKTLLSCTSYNSLSGGNINLPNNTYYVRISINISSNLTWQNTPKFTGNLCINGNQALNDTNKGILGKLKDLFSFFNNDDIDSDTTSDTFDDLNDNLPTNSVISDLLLLPVTLLQSIVNSLGGSCSSFNLGSLYGTNLIMPCIDLQSYLGNTIWTFIDLVFSGMFILVIRKKFIEIWENITNLRNGGNEVD